VAGDYQIVAQHQSVTVGPAGELLDVMNITFSTPSGASGQVSVPITEYTAERVAQLVGERAAIIAQVAEL
jgi:hypothetical protein